MIEVLVDTLGDADGDGLANGVEIMLGTDPEDSDTDNDFASDFIELNRDNDPSNYTAGIDTDPNNPDTDGDGVLDGADYAPLDPDAGDEQVPALPWWGLAGLALAMLLAAQHIDHAPRSLARCFFSHAAFKADFLVRVAGHARAQAGQPLQVDSAAQPALCPGTIVYATPGLDNSAVSPG